jgi:hypothetical protein
MPSHLADRYTQRHFNRALAPMIASSSSSIGKLLMPRQILATMLTVRDIYRYARSGQDVAGPAARVARIRARMETILFAGVPDVPEGALEPFLDYISEKIAAETVPEPEEGASEGHSW